MAAKGLSAAEQETTLTRTRNGEWTLIDTTIRKDLTALRKAALRPHAEIEELDSGFFGTTEWAKFRILTDRWTPTSGVKRQVSPERRAAMAAAARERGFGARA